MTQQYPSIVKHNIVTQNIYQDINLLGTECVCMCVCARARAKERERETFPHPLSFVLGQGKNKMEKTAKFPATFIGEPETDKSASLCWAKRKLFTWMAPHAKQEALVC